MDPALLLRTSPHAVAVAGLDGTLLDANPAAERLLGVRVGTRLPDLVAPEERSRLVDLLEGADLGREPGPVRLRLATSPTRWIAVQAVPAVRGRVQLALSDDTAVVLERRQRRATEAAARAAFDAGITGMGLLGADGRYLFVNAALARLLGRAPEDLAGRTHEELTAPEDRDGAALTDVLTGAPGRLRAPVRFLRPDGQPAHGLVTTVPLEGAAPTVFVQVEDVTERHASDQRLQHLALHDALTDLPGRPLVLGRLQEALAGRGPGLVAVLFVDLDGFKLVNDALGHAAGDRVLVDAAARLREAVRTSDTVGRFGGDEFLVVCPSLASREEGLLVARRIERAIARPFPLEGDEVLVSASVGVAFADPAAAVREGVELSGSALVEDADTAMYRAKQLGKRRFEVFDQAMRERAAERGRLERLLARAVEEDRVVVVYQPVVELVSRRVVALEALVRLCDDDGTLLAPDAFLAVARESGVLARLDDVVLDRATRAVAGWRRGLGLDLELAVNVCAQQVAADLPDKVDRALAGSGLPADRLVVELTEQTLMSSAGSAGRALQRLADRGVQLALDDFGTGWASLTYLRRYPVQKVKVDRSFVAGLPHEAGDRVVVQAVVDLSAQLGLGCVAEGVETEEQYTALAGLRPPFAQGYLFSRPLADEDVPAALTS